MRALSFSFSVLLSFAVCGVAVAQSDDPFSDPAPTKTAKKKIAKQAFSTQQPPGDSAKSVEDRIYEALNSPATLSYDETPWVEIEEALEREYKFNIVLDSSARDDSLTADEPITCNLKGIDLKNALRIMLKEKNATYVVRNEILLIISLDDADDVKYFDHAFINVRPLLAKLAELEKDRIGQPRILYKLPPVTNVIPVVGAVQGFGGDRRGGGVFNVGNQAKVNEPQENIAKPGMASATPVEMITAESLLIELIHSSVEGESWLKTGQGQATCDIIGGYVVANTTAESADELRDFLEELTKNILKD